MQTLYNAGHTLGAYTLPGGVTINDDGTMTMADGTIVYTGGDPSTDPVFSDPSGGYVFPDGSYVDAQGNVYSAQQMQQNLGPPYVPPPAQKKKSSWTDWFSKPVWNGAPITNGAAVAIAGSVAVFTGLMNRANRGGRR